MPEAWAHEILDKISEPQSLVEGMTRANGGEGMYVAKLVDEEL